MCAQPKEVEADFASAVFQDEGAFAEEELWARCVDEIERANIIAHGSGGEPALGFVAVHFVGDALVGESGGAGSGPHDVAVGVIAVRVRIEDEADRLG